MTTVSKPIMAVANKLAAITAPSLKIREEREQTQLEAFIAKISLILHNLFTKGEFNIDLNDDSINKVVLEIAVQCKQIIDQYNINPEDIKLDSEPITVEAFPNIQIKFEINKNKLNVTLIESDQVYYFPQEELLLSIDLSDETKQANNLNAMDKVLPSVSHFIDKLEKLQITNDVKLSDFITKNRDIILNYAKSCKEKFCSTVGEKLYNNLQSKNFGADDIIPIMSFYFSNNLNITELKNLKKSVSDCFEMIDFIPDKETLNRRIINEFTPINGISGLRSQLGTIMMVLDYCCLQE